MVDYDDPLYLVVGTQTECKTTVAEMLGGGCGATQISTSKAGVRTFTRHSSTSALVVDTVPFQHTYFAESDWLRFARTWISMNGLRRLCGRYVKLVSVVNSTVSVDDTYADNHPALVKVSWLHLLVCIFKEYREATMILVNSDDSRACNERRFRMKDVLLQEGIEASHIILADLRRGHPVPAVVHSFSLGGPQEDVRRCIESFLLKEVAPNDLSSRRFGPWGPERVILFGRTGSGKSTLAQMLISGKLEPFGQPFTISSGCRGSTTKVVRGEGRGWYVVDTPGFGEPTVEHSSTSTQAAEKKIRKYVQIIEGTYSHYLYVVKKDRIDMLEQKLWHFFLLLFGEDLKFHFTVVITNTDDEWIEENRVYMEQTFEGCQSFVSADFPQFEMDDDELERDNEVTRAASLCKFEEELASRQRFDVFCHIGRFSNITARGEVASITNQIKAVKSLPKKVTSTLKAAALWLYADVRRLISILVHDDKMLLLPLVDDDENTGLLDDHHDS